MDALVYQFSFFVLLFTFLGFLVGVLRVVQWRRSSFELEENPPYRPFPNQRRGRHRHQRTSSLLVFFTGVFMGFLFLLLPFISKMVHAALDLKGTVTVYLLLCLLGVSVILSILGRGLELNE